MCEEQKRSVGSEDPEKFSGLKFMINVLQVKIKERVLFVSQWRFMVPKSSHGIRALEGLSVNARLPDVSVASGIDNILPVWSLESGFGGCTGERRFTEPPIRFSIIPDRDRAPP